MPGARARLKEFWIRGKRINSVNHIIAIKKQVEKNIRREIKYISSFFPYNIEKFHNPDLLYYQGIFLLNSLPSDSPDNHNDRDSDLKLMNLIAGLELISIGTSFHNFKTGGLVMYSSDAFGGKEKEYTLDLLFGDIFYSRAVIYLLKYQDHRVFDQILAALKKLHASRLILHQSILRSLEKDIDFDHITNDINPLIDANKLLDVSFGISFDLFCSSKLQDNTKKYFDLTRQIILLKTYTDLFKYTSSLPEDLPARKISGYLASKKSFTGKQLSDIISELDSDNFKSSLKTIVGSLDK